MLSDEQISEIKSRVEQGDKKNHIANDVACLFFIRIPPGGLIDLDLKN